MEAEKTEEATLQNVIDRFDWSIIKDLEDDSIAKRGEASKAEASIQQVRTNIKQAEAQIEQLVGSLNFLNGSTSSNQVTAERILTKAGLTFQNYLDWKATQVPSDVTTSEAIN